MKNDLREIWQRVGIVWGDDQKLSRNYEIYKEKTV